MRKAIYADESLDPKQKTQVWGFVKARAGEARVDKLQQDEARDRDFMNQVIGLRKQGQPLDSALKLAGRYGSDAYDKSVKEDAAKKMYGSPSKSDPTAYLTAWERVQEGKASREELDALQTAGRINVEDWRALNKERHNILTKGQSPERQQVQERVKLLADSKFGKNKRKKDEFLYEMQASGKDKSPEEYWKLANDKLKDDPSTGMYGMFQETQWKSDLKKRDAKNLAWGKLYEDLGKAEVTAIGKGFLDTGTKDWGPEDVDFFASTFGGYDNIKPGTPVHNAIRSIMKMPAGKRVLVTPANVKKLLDSRPDGNY
jgi:hypothetical protein